jgi:hypothetical protein
MDKVIIVRDCLGNEERLTKEEFVAKWSQTVAGTIYLVKKIEDYDKFEEVVAFVKRLASEKFDRFYEWQCNNAKKGA